MLKTITIMELEQLQQSWNKLSEKLDREEVLRKQELRMLAESRVKSYWSKVRMNQEQMIIRFEKLFIRNNIITACFLAFVFAYVIIEAVIRHSVLSTEWWLWVILTFIGSAVLIGWQYLRDKDRIDEIKQRITALKQFEE